MKSINHDNDNIWDDDISMISNSSMSQFSKLNKINKNMLSDYHIVLILKAKKVEKQINGDLNNLMRYINFKSYYENESNKKEKEKKKYYFRFFIGNQMLAPVELVNDAEISKITNSPLLSALS